MDFLTAQSLIDKIDTKIENICLTNTCFSYYFCIVNEQSLTADG